MPDIRLARPRTSQIWYWTGILAALALLIWVSALYLGDPTEREDVRVGAALDFGAQRAPLLPIEPVDFGTLVPLADRDLGSLVHLAGTVETPVRTIGRTPGAWVRAEDGRRILVRFEPPPPENALAGIRPGGRIEVEGYVTNISLAEVHAWADTLGIRVPRPPPAPRFGTAPPSGYEQVLANFISDYYISVRPEGIDAAARRAEADAEGS